MMKNVVSALFAVYSLSSGQQPPVVPPGPAVMPPLPVMPPPPVMPQVLPVIPPGPPIVVPPVVEIPLNPPIAPPMPPVQPAPLPPVQLPIQPPAPLPVPFPFPLPAPPVPVQPIQPPLVAQPPFGQAFGAYDQICGPPEIENVCQLPSQFASDILLGTPGFMKCEREFDCCPCKSITCGTLLGTGCNTISFGTSGAFGVKDIKVIGKPAPIGANIEVLGLEGAMNAVMTGNNVIKVASSGEMGLRNALVKVDIINGFKMQCDAMGSCQGSKLEFVIPGPPPGYACNPAVIFPDVIIPEVRCGGQASCENAEIVIRNNGCGHVQIDKVQCTELDSCNNAKFSLIGDIEIITCDIRASGQTTKGLERCFANLERLLCPDVDSCIGPEKRILRDPANGFLMECGGRTSCAGSDIYIDVSSNPANGAINHFEGFKFGGVGSGSLATVTISNKQVFSPITIELIECPSQNSCAQLTIYTGSDVSIREFKCAPGACNGCTYQKDASPDSPVYACDPNAAFSNPMIPPQGVPPTFVPPSFVPPVMPPPPQTPPQTLPAVVLPPGVVPVPQTPPQTPPPPQTPAAVDPVDPVPPVLPLGVVPIPEPQQPAVIIDPFNPAIPVPANPANPAGP